MKLIISIIALASLSYSDAKLAILSDIFIASINEKQSTWTAGRNFPEDTPIESLKRLNGYVIAKEPSYIDEVKLDLTDVDIPETFDGRNQWSACESLKNIRDQGQCGACWAFASAEAMTDRTCIASKGSIKFQFSPEELITCCSDCGKGCDGGDPLFAHKYWISSGIVSGGDYGSNEGCQPYAESIFKNGTEPQCSNECSNSDYEISYKNDKHYGSSYYQIYNKTVEEIQVDVMTNGPVVTHMDVYDDFYNYQSGVYQHVSGDEPGSHAVKIIGWGTENGVPYWLVANSWGTAWGDLDGFFKILRGENHCRIEWLINAAMPQV